MEPARQLIVLCDGTNNNLTGGRADTNVLKLLQRLPPDDARQQVFYDPGVGNPGQLPSTDRISRWLERVAGLAFGRGAYENMAESYAFLMRHYRPGDEIYIFGFSRGAFTARAVAGMVNQFGLLRPGLENMLPTLLHVYFSSRKGKDNKAQVAAVSSQIRHLFTDAQRSEVWVHFTGVWDTVASIGFPPFTRQITGSPTITGKRMRHVRQALALDEHRRPFEPRLYLEDDIFPANAQGQTLRQRWFSGAHCDIGGGYAPAEAGLSDQALAWLLQEAADQGLHLAAAVPQEAAALAGRRLVHCETWATPWWAIGGLCVRDPRHAKDENGRLQAVTPVAFTPEITPEATPAARPAAAPAPVLHYPQDTVWRRPRKAAAPLLAACAMLLLWLAMGLCLLDGPVGTDPAAWAAAAWQANAGFARWQLWPFEGCDLVLPGPEMAAKSALALDMAFIAAYGYLLAWLTSHGFAALADLRGVASPRRPLLNILGCGLMVLVLGDLSEDAVTLLILLFQNHWYGWLLWLAGAAMAAASLAKWLGLLLTLVLVAWGCWAQLRRHGSR